MKNKETENTHPDGLPKILPPYENGVFQAVLTLPEAHAALEGVVAALIERPVKAVTLRNNAAPVRDIGAKQEQYDVNCVVDAEDGDQCNIEMQASPMAGDSMGNEHRNIRWRSAFNLCDLHSNQKGSGLRYGQFVRSYQVMLCNYGIFAENQKLVERFTLRSLEGRELCEAVTAIIIDLSQAKMIATKPVPEMTDIEQWAIFFALANKPEYSGIIDEITKRQEGIAVAQETLFNISQNPDERARFHSRRMWLQDREHEHAVWLDEGRELGREQGREQGREEAREEYEQLLASKDSELASKDSELAALRAQLEAIKSGRE